MATRLANDYYTIMAEEAAYGTQIKDLTSGVAMSDVICEIKKDVIKADTKIKTNTLAPDNEESIVTATAGTVTLKGNLCTGYQILLQAYTHCAATPYTMTNPQPASGFTYTLYKYYPGVAPYYDYAAGCVMSDLKLSGEANGIIQFEATFRAQSIGRGIASATGNALSNVPANTPSTPFLYGAATVSLSNSASNLISFNLSLSKSFVDDRITYQNSATKLAEIITGYSGSWEYSTAYDDVNDPLMELIIGSTAANDTLELNSGAVEWTIVVNYVLDEFTLADADKSLFESKFTCRLAFDDSTQPFTVTVT